jgi:heme oxygenase
MTTAAQPPPAGLAVMLRAGTARAHRASEAGSFVQGLLHGVVDRGAYCRFLQALRAVYGALEAGLVANAADPRVAPLVRPEVFRVAALDADLAFFAVTPRPPLASTLRYVAHLEGLSMHAPWLLAAHAYTRTLGDLSGGQVLERCLQQALGLKGDDGCAFYAFPAIADFAAYKNGYREALDALPLSAAEREGLVAEAVLAFELNAAITRELQPEAAAAAPG